MVVKLKKENSKILSFGIIAGTMLITLNSSLNIRGKPKKQIHFTFL